MSTPAQLSVVVWTTRFLGTKPHASALLDLLRGLDGGRWVPDRWGISEPVRRRFDSGAEQELIRCWTADSPPGSGEFWNDIILSHRHPHAAMWVVIRRWIGLLGILNTVDFDLPANAFLSSDGVSRIKHILRSLIVWSRAEYGSVSYSREKHVRRAVGTPLDRLAQIHWLNFFGHPYIDMFGRERVLTAPVCAVEPIGDLGLTLQTTRDFNDADVTDSDSLFLHVEECLGREAVATQYRGSVCRVPVFDLSEVETPRRTH